MSIPLDSATTPSDISEVMPDKLTNGSEPTYSFWETIAPSAKRYAMSIVRRWSDAEEIVQEAFYRLIASKRKSNQPETSLTKAIVFTTIRNISIDHLRRNGRRQFESVDTQTIASRTQKSTGVRLERLEDCIETSLNSGPEQWAEALRLKINGELSYAEIAEVMNATHAQVRTWIFRARKRLQSDLKQQGLLESGGAQ